MGTTLQERVEGITEVVRGNVDAIEQGRRITDEVLAAVRSTGLNRSLVPLDLGGAEVPVVEVVAAVEALAAVDGSTGWCAAIGSGSNVFAGYVEAEVAKAAYPDPDAPSAGVFMPGGQVRPNGDGLSLTGRWPFSSNCLHSRTIGVGAFFYDAAGEMEPIPRLVLVSMDDVEVEDTWDASGLRGTGSHHTAVTDVPVQRAQSMAFVEKPWAEGPLWRLPIFSVLAPVLGIVPLGIARGALDQVAERIRSGTAGQRGALVDDPIGLADYADAVARLRSARAGLDAACARAWELAEAGLPVTAEVQGHVQLAVNHGCEVAVDVTGVAHRLGGGSAAYNGSSLLRSLRDVETARQHIMFGRSHRPIFAKAIAGLPVFAPPFIL